MCMFTEEEKTKCSYIFPNGDRYGEFFLLRFCNLEPYILNINQYFELIYQTMAQYLSAFQNEGKMQYKYFNIWPFKMSHSTGEFSMFGTLRHK